MIPRVRRHLHKATTSSRPKFLSYKMVQFFVEMRLLQARPMKITSRQRLNFPKRLPILPNHLVSMFLIGLSRKGVNFASVTPAMERPSSDTGQSSCQKRATNSCSADSESIASGIRSRFVASFKYQCCIELLSLKIKIVHV